MAQMSYGVASLKTLPVSMTKRRLITILMKSLSMTRGLFCRVFFFAFLDILLCGNSFMRKKSNRSRKKCSKIKKNEL